MLGILAFMGILKTVTDELRRVQAERALQDLLEVVRRQIDVLTFGDLAGLVSSPLGKQLAAVKLSAAFGPPPDPEAAATSMPAGAGAAVAAVPAASKMTRRAAGKKTARKGKAKTNVKAKSASSSTAKRTSTKSRASTKRGRPAKAKKAASTKTTAASSAPARGAVLAKETAVLRVLAASETPLTIREVLGAAKLSLSQASRTLQRLVAAGKIQMIGPKNRPTYALTQGTAAEASEPTLTSPAAGPTPTTSKARPLEVTARTLAGRAAYDGAILAALRDAGDWTAATDLRAKVGGSSDQLRFGLGRLAAAGKLTKTGERGNTRYKSIEGPILHRQ